MRASMGRSLLLVLLLTVAAAAQAQLWTGPAALEVRAEDNGRPAAGGEVRLEYLDMEPSDGPAPVPLDSRGRAVIGGLAEGHWRLEVSRQGAMTYRAEILVRADGKPQLINAVQHNVPGAVSMMEVKLARARGGAAPPPRRIAGPTPMPEPAQPAPAPAPAPPAPQPATPPPAPAPIEREAPAPAPTPEPAAPEPATPAPAPVEREAPTPPPAPAPETPPPPAPRPEPREEAPTPAPQPATPPPAPAPVPEREAPTPAPAPETPPPPAPRPEPRRETPRPVQPPTPAPAPETPPVPAPAPAPVPPGEASRRSHQDKTCAECKPGESALSIAVVAPPAAGAAGCGDGLREALLRREVTGLPAGCQMLRLELPPNARYIGYRYEVQDGGSAAATCEAGKDCPAGGARWPMDPLLFRDGTGKTMVSAAFENRSANERRAVLTVYFKEAGNPNAPRPMLRSRPRQDPPGR